jgi:hypothetical protein
MPGNVSLNKKKSNRLTVLKKNTEFQMYRKDYSHVYVHTYKQLN